MSMRYYLLFINALSFLLMLADKQKAKKKQWRISEATLLWVSIFGGSVGTFLGMHLARHKTRKTKFRIGIPVILCIQILLTAGILLFFHGLSH